MSDLRDETEISNIRIDILILSILCESYGANFKTQFFKAIDTQSRMTAVAYSFGKGARFDWDERSACYPGTDTWFDKCVPILPTLSSSPSPPLPPPINFQIRGKWFDRPDRIAVDPPLPPLVPTALPPIFSLHRSEFQDRSSLSHAHLWVGTHRPRSASSRVNHSLAQSVGPILSVRPQQTAGASVTRSTQAQRGRAARTAVMEGDRAGVHEDETLATRIRRGWCKGETLCAGPIRGGVQSEQVVRLPSDFGRLEWVLRVGECGIV